MNQKISKSQIIAEIAEEQGKTKTAVKEAIDAFIDKIEDAVAAGDSVTIQGFGRLYSRPAQGRSFRKINSNEVINVGPRVLPKTKFSKKFIEKVKGE